MKLAQFIRLNIENIAQEWETFAKSLPGFGGTKDKFMLRDGIRDILEAIANDIESPQDATEKDRKARGLNEIPPHKKRAAHSHAVFRAKQGSSLADVISEYRALRASVIKLWRAELKTINSSTLEDITRFNEAIDQAIVESTIRFTRELENSQNIFLGILGHDLRTPAGAISMSAHLLAASGTLDDRHMALAVQMVNSAARINQMITDLLDLTRIRLGTGIQIEPSPMSMKQLCLQILEETQAFYPHRLINFQSQGDSLGEWDSARMGQVISNLLGNALQHGYAETPVVLRVSGNDTEVAIAVHNEGKAIPPESMETIFESMVQEYSSQPDELGLSKSLGLGLYIAREIVEAHNGRIAVTSAEETGTTFTVYIPRHAETSYS